MFYYTNTTLFRTTSEHNTKVLSSKVLMRPLTMGNTSIINKAHTHTHIYPRADITAYIAHLHRIKNYKLFQEYFSTFLNEAEEEAPTCLSVFIFSIELTEWNLSAPHKRPLLPLNA